MSFFIRIILVVTLSFSPSVVLSEDKSDANLKSLLDQFHHEIEGDSETQENLKAILSQWLNNFNLARISMDTHRWTQMKYYQDSNKNEYVRNFPVLASMYFMSHTIEVLSGPMGVYMASHLGLSSTVQVAVGAVGAIISIPGLDPLCILLFAISPLKPVQKAMTSIRVVSVQLSNTVSKQLGLKNAMSAIFENKDRISEILKVENTRLIYNAQSDEIFREVMLENSQRIPYLKIAFKTDQERTWVRSIEVLDTKLSKENASHIDKVLSQMNLSVRYALRDSLKNPKKAFYIASAESSESRSSVEFQDYSLLLKPQITLKTASRNENVQCGNLFR